MKKIKLFILTIISLMIISLSCITHAANTISQGVNDVTNGAKSVGQDLKNGASNIGAGASSIINDTKNGVLNAVSDTTNTLNNDIRNGVNDNANANNTNNSVVASPDPNMGTNYSTTRVGYTADTINFLGIPMSRTAVTLLIVALAAIIVAILVFSYVSQDNDRYRDRS